MAASSSDPVYTDRNNDEGYQVDSAASGNNGLPSESTASDGAAVSDHTKTMVHQPESNIPLLHSLAQQGDLERIRELLDKGEAKATDVDAEGITALHWAAMNSAMDVCRLLLERGAEVDAVGGELQATPLHWATR